jgi:hypothetical protein
MKWLDHRAMLGPTSGSTVSRIDGVEDLVGQQEVQQARVAVVRGVQLVGELVALVGEVLVEDLLQPGQLLLREELAARKQVAVRAEELDVLLGQHGLAFRSVRVVRSAPARG